MSAYITFYIKTNSDEYIPIGDYSGSSDIFQAFREYIPYGKNVPVTTDLLVYIKEDLNKSIKYFNSTIQTIANIINDIPKFNNTIEEKNQLLFEKYSEINEYKEYINESTENIKFIEHLEFLLDAAAETSWYSNPAHKYDVNNFIIAGYEADWPGKEDSSKE